MSPTRATCWQGRWHPSGETIKLDTSGELLDGQYRLSAIAVAGVTVPMIVMSNVSPDVMLTVDAGAKLSFSDALKLQGEDNTATLAAVTRRAVMWERGQRTNTAATRPTPLEMNQFLVEPPEIRMSAGIASNLGSREGLPASVMNPCHWLFADQDADAATSFLMRVADGHEVPADRPIAHLRNRVTRLRSAAGTHQPYRGPCADDPSLERTPGR